MFDLLLTTLFLVNGVGSVINAYFYPNDEICGITEEMQNELRTFNPWNVAIYMRKDLKSPFEYFLTGTLISRNLVISGFGGGFGHPRHKNKRYFIPPPNHFLIVAAIKSTNISESDAHTQQANCSYVAAHGGVSTNFHYVIFRLAQDLNLQTPYVRPVCNHFYLAPYLSSIGAEGPIEDLLVTTDHLMSVGGFNAPPGVKGPYKHVFASGKADNNMRCTRSYKYHYKPEPGERAWCFRIDSDSENVTNSTCLTHGSGMVWESDLEELNSAIGSGPRSYITGVVGLIPRKGLGQCNINTEYYSLFSFNDIQWMKDHMLCQNPLTFPCQNNGTCIPLEQVCDEKQDCENGEDEEPIYCSATKLCRNRDDYQCGYGGKCISQEQVGDGNIDCPNGSDEDEKLQNNTRFSKGMKSKTPCFSLVTTKGVIINCTHYNHGIVSCSDAPTGSKAIFTCAPCYSPQQKFNYAIMNCYDDGSWKPFRKFTCQPECGLLGREVNEAIVGNEISNKSKSVFSWHVAIFKTKRDDDKSFEYICAASLIERNVIITAAHCTTDADGGTIDVRRFRVVLNSISTNLTEINGNNDDHIFEVEEMWRPDSFDEKTRQSDIAILKLSKPVIYTETLRPVCYTMKKYLNLPPVNSVGVIPDFSVTETGKTSVGLKYANLTVVSKDDCAPVADDKFCARSKTARQTICSGNSGGGLVFPTEEGSNGLGKFVLKGIASELPQPKEYGCVDDPRAPFVFTHVDSHIEWLLTTLEGIDVNPDF